MYFVVMGLEMSADWLPSVLLRTLYHTSIVVPPLPGTRARKNRFCGVFISFNEARWKKVPPSLDFPFLSPSGIRRRTV